MSEDFFERPESFRFGEAYCHGCGRSMRRKPAGGYCDQCSGSGEGSYETDEEKRESIKRLEDRAAKRRKEIEDRWNR